MSSSSFLIHSQSSIEVRQFFRTNFIEILVSDYTVHRTFVWEKVCHFWEIERRMILNTGGSLCSIKLKTIQDIKF